MTRKHKQGFHQPVVVRKDAHIVDVYEKTPRGEPICIRNNTITIPSPLRDTYLDRQDQPDITSCVLYAKKPEYREKLSEGVKKVLEDPKMREKWSEAKKGKNNGRWKGYLVICKGGEVLEKYESIVEASRQTGINRDTISRKTKDGKPYKNKNSKYNGCTFQLDAGGGCDA